MQVLAKGENAPVTVLDVRASISWQPSPGSPDVDVSALLLTAEGKVRSDADFVFYNQPTHASQAVRHTGKDGATDSIDVNLAAVESDIERIVLAASSDGGTFGQVGALTVTLVEPTGVELVRFTTTGATETAFVAGELYLRSGQWKFRAVGQGYSDGLAGLATDFGISVDDDDHSEPPPQPHSLIKGAEKLPAPMRERLNLRKEQVAISLRKAGAPPSVVARVVVVVDASGSMRKLFDSGTVTTAVERIAAVAAALDDDATMQAWMFADNPGRLPDLQVGDLPSWSELHLRICQIDAAGRVIRAPLLPGQIDMIAVGFGNEEQKVINEIRRFVFDNPLDVPTLVLFFSDGGVYMDEDIEAEIRDAECQPIFWQFIGLGNADFGVLQHFDTMEGRSIDNVGFFAVADINTIADQELYDLLLQEFPKWINAAQAAGIRNDVFGKPPTPPTPAPPQRRGLFGRRS